MGRELLNLATVLLVVCATVISASVVIIQPVARKISILQEDDIVFDCRHPPNDSVEWYLSGMKITNTSFDGNRFIFEEESETKTGDEDGSVISRLTVNDIRQSEAGHYKCSNADFEKALFEDNQSDEVIVEVMKLGTAVNIIGPANNTVTRGDDLLLMCSGDITAKLVWQFKGEPLSEDLRGRVIITPEENRDTDRDRLALTRSRATTDHEGLYTCHDEVNREHSSVLVKVTETGKVSIVQPAHETTIVVEGSDFVFECQHPSGESVQWFRSSMRLFNQTSGTGTRRHLSIETEGTTASILTISSINRNEAGTYRCSNADLKKALHEDGQIDSVNVEVINVETGASLDDSSNVQGSSTLLAMTAFTAAVVLAISG